MPASVKFREAYARGIPLIHYDRLSAGAEAYRTAAAAYLTGRVQSDPVAERPAESRSRDEDPTARLLRSIDVESDADRCR